LVGSTIEQCRLGGTHAQATHAANAAAEHRGPIENQQELTLEDRRLVGTNVQVHARRKRSQIDS
jgi:hypothetical protein